ncbi:MAG: folate-binding protein YgfZ [Gammaproteobacteria bacterium]|nr:folate-binding protein YgfZ [Gammaproteobacteria bacterium]
MKITHSLFALENYSIVKISGDNSANFLQGQFTCDVTQVNEHKSSLGALCNPQGRILAVFTLFKRGSEFFCLLSSSLVSHFINHLSKFAAFSKVTLNDITADFFLYGYTGEQNSDWFDAGIPLPNEVRASAELLICHLPGRTPRYLIWSDKAQDSAKITAPEEVNTQRLSWKLVDILSGHATIYPQTIATVTPHMLNLHHLEAVSFSKGCYVGQEIVARTHYLGKSKRHLHHAEINSNVQLDPGELIFAGDQEVGILMDSVVIDSTTFLLIVIQDPMDRMLTLRKHPLIINASPLS